MDKIAHRTVRDRKDLGAGLCRTVPDFQLQLLHLLTNCQVFPGSDGRGTNLVIHCLPQQTAGHPALTLMKAVNNSDSGCFWCLVLVFITEQKSEKSKM